MFKVITLLKRRQGLSLDAFIRQYEAEHARIGEKNLRGRAVHYERRYLHPLPSLRPADAHEPAYDVVMEIWYEDRAAYDRAVLSLRDPVNAGEIAEDEERLFDRATIRSFVVEEHVSEL